jgi:hypothetical protein
MSENDVLAALIVTTGVVKLTALALRYRAGQKAADRKTAVKP